MVVRMVVRMVVNVDDVDGLITAPTSLLWPLLLAGDLDDARKPGPKAGNHEVDEGRSFVSIFSRTTAFRHRAGRVIDY